MSDNKIWVTYILRKENDELYTVSDIYNEDSIEHKNIINYKYFVSLFKGEDYNLTIEKANKLIRKIQKEKIENISFDDIRKINTVKPQKSYVLLPNNKGYILEPKKAESDE